MVSLTALRFRVASLSFGALAFAGVALAPMHAEAQTRRGPLTVLGLRAPDGEDESASQVSESLRQTARAMGFTVADDPPPLEQLVAALGCEDPLPAACLTQIATTIHAERFVYGTVRRTTRERSGPLRIDLQIYIAGQATLPAAQNVELPRATTMDGAQLSGPSRRLLEALLPPPQATQVVVARPVTPPPEVRNSGPPVPVRRYLGYGLIGLGGAAMIGGAVAGGLWFGLTGELSATSNMSDRATQWQAYQPFAVTTGAANPNASGGDVCSAANGQRPTQPDNYNTTNYNLARNARELCASSGTLQGASFGLLGVGAAVLATGLILVVTDHTGAAAPADASGRRARVQPQRPLFFFTPTLSPTYQGGSLLMQF